MKNKDESIGKIKQNLRKEFILKSQRKNLALIRQEVENAARECGFNDSDIYQMKVAVSEAAANAIEHGSPRGEENNIKVNIECNDGKILIEVADEGVFKARLPVTNGRPSHRGRGIFLMTALMDSVTIDETPTGTIVRLEKKKESTKGTDFQQLESLM